MLYVIENAETGEVAAIGCEGEHDGKFTKVFAEALTFETRSEAYEFAQNFGHRWNVAEY